jgi:hypothetical protein
MMALSLKVKRQWINDTIQGLAEATLADPPLLKSINSFISLLHCFKQI